MKILGLNRVELLLPDHDLDDAIVTFNAGLGFELCKPLKLDEGIRSSVDFAAGLELVSPADENSPVFPLLTESKTVLLADWSGSQAVVRVPAGSKMNPMGPSSSTTSVTENARRSSNQGQVCDVGATNQQDHSHRRQQHV